MQSLEGKDLRTAQAHHSFALAIAGKGENGKGKKRREWGGAETKSERGSWKAFSLMLLSLSTSSASPLDPPSPLRPGIIQSSYLPCLAADGPFNRAGQRREKGRLFALSELCRSCELPNNQAWLAQSVERQTLMIFIDSYQSFYLKVGGSTPPLG